MRSPGSLFNLMLYGLAAVTFFVTAGAHARDLRHASPSLCPTLLDRVLSPAESTVLGRLGYLPRVEVDPRVTRGGVRLDLAARGADDRKLSELSVELISPAEVEVLFVGTDETVRSHGLTHLLWERVIRDHPGFRVVTTTMALDNERDIRDRFNAGASCEAAIRESAYAKVLIRSGFIR